MMRFPSTTGRAVVRGRAVMIVPYHQPGRRRKVLCFRELDEWEPSPSGLLQQ